MDPKPLTIDVVLGFLGGLGGYPQGGLGPQAGRFQGPGAFEGATPPMVGIFSGVPCPALPCPALPCPTLPCPALPCPALPCPALPCPALPALPCPALPCPALPCPALPCPALPALPCPALPWPCPALPCPALPCPALPGCVAFLLCPAALAMLSSNPHRVREARCLLGTLVSRRAAGTGREDPQPDNNPFQLRFCCDTHILCRVRREAESEKAPP